VNRFRRSSAAELSRAPQPRLAFRSTGFGVDTIAMLPLWRFSFYGRMGAYRGDARGGYGSAAALLPRSSSRAARACATAWACATTSPSRSACARSSSALAARLAARHRRRSRRPGLGRRELALLGGLLD
jgi:hypothetical protein